MDVELKSSPESPAGIEVQVARRTDAEGLLGLKLALDNETTMMMYESGERLTDAKAVELELQRRIESPISTILVAEQGSQLVGYVEAMGGEFRRTRHAAMVTAGVRTSHAGQGIGSLLFQKLIDWADAAGMIRLELTVMAHNAAARALYEKFGFLTEGMRKCSMWVDGRCVDELAMARLRRDFAECDRNE